MEISLLAHLSERDLDRYRERRMPPAELLAANDHLADCEECYRRFGREPELLGATYEFVRAELETAGADGEAFARRAGRDYRVPLQIAAAVAGAVLGFWGSWLATLPMRGRVVALRTQFARLEEGQARPGQARAGADREPEDATQAPRIVLALEDGGRRVTLDEQGNLRGLPPLPPEYERAVLAALTTRRLQLPPILATLAGVSPTRRGAGGEAAAFKLLGPAATVILTDRPTFRWEPLAAATSYTVTVVDSDFNEVATSRPLSATEWTVPRAMKRGEVYSWQVRAHRGGEEIVVPPPTAPEARFKILERRKAAELARINESVKDSPLALAVICAANGLVGEAARELEVLSEANPGSPVAGSWRRRIRAALEPAAESTR